MNRCRARRLAPHLASSILAALALVAAAGARQAEPVNGMHPSGPRVEALVGARVVVAPGAAPIEATIVIEEGRIVALGPDVEPPPGARVRDLAGLVLYPGLIDAGVLVPAADLPDGVGRDPNPLIRPERRLAEGPAPDAALRSTLRGLGFALAATHPDSGILRGTGVVTTLAEGAAPRRLRDDVFMAAGLARSRGGYPGSLMGAIALVRQTLLDAAWHRDALEAWRRAPEANVAPATAPGLAALAPVLAGDRPLLFDAANELDALRAATLAREQGLGLVILGGGTEFRRLREIAALGAPTILPLDFPDRPDVADARAAERVDLRELMTWEQGPTNPRRLLEAGVPIVLTTERLGDRKDFPARLREAIRNGLDPDDALAALTTAPARLLGIEEEAGTIAVGRPAHLLAASGPLFAKETELRAIWIDGVHHELEAKKEPRPRFVGAFVGSDGTRRRARVDLERPAFALAPARDAGAEDEEDDAAWVAAKSVERSGDRVAAVIDGASLGRSGWVRLAGAFTGDALLGEGVASDGSRFDFTIEREEDLEPEAPRSRERSRRGGGERGVAPRGDAVAGAWSVMVIHEGVEQGMPGVIVLERDAAGGLDGTIDALQMQLPIEGAAHDPATGLLTLRFPGPDGEPVRLEAHIEGDEIAGVVTAEAFRGRLTGRRRADGATGDDGAADDDGADFDPAPEALAWPIGAYGRAERPAPRDVLLAGGTIWTSGPEGIVEQGWMLVRDGRVAAIGSGAVETPAGIERIELAGRHVTPGLIDCHSHTGISGGVNEFGHANTAEVGIGDVIDPDDVDWYRQLAGGLTAVNQLHGSANPIGGRNSVVKIRWGGGPEAFPLRGAPSGIKFALGENVVRSSGRYPDTRMGVEAFIRDAFTAARADAEERARRAALPLAERRRLAPLRRDLELEALAEILAGERLVHCHSYRQDEILMLIRIADDFGFTIGTFQHVLEGYKVADRIAEHGAGASSFSDWWAYKIEVMDAIPANGALMTDVGIVVSFNSDSDELARRMNTEAAKAVRYGGLDPGEALKLVTLNPAIQLGIDERVGSLEPGKDADFAIWSGSPLSTYTRCEQTWIEGAVHFDLAEDAMMRARDRAERMRIVAKLLRAAHGEAGGGEEAKEEAPGRRDLADADPIDDATRREWEELVRLGRDPLESSCGDCGVRHGHAHHHEEHHR